MTCARSLTWSRSPISTPCPASVSTSFEQGGGMDHHAVADHAVDPRPEDAGRDQRELVRHPVGDDRVPGVGPPLIAHDGVVLVAEQVDDLPLGLVSPLQAHHASRSHGATSPDEVSGRRFGRQRIHLTGAAQTRQSSRQGAADERGKRGSESEFFLTFLIRVFRVHPQHSPPGAQPIIVRNSAKRYWLSCGPAEASGWYWTPKIGQAACAGGLRGSGR